MKKLLSWFKNEESGQGMVEYGLIIGLVAVALIVALTALQGQIAGIFSKVQAGISSSSTAST